MSLTSQGVGDSASHRCRREVTFLAIDTSPVDISTLAECFAKSPA